MVRGSIYSIDTSIVNVLYELSVSDPDDYLSDYIIRLILNGGPVNGGEIIESTGQFSDGLSIASVSGAFVFPIGTTEGQWNTRVIINDESNNQTNMGPNQLSENNFDTNSALKELPKSSLYEYPLQPDLSTPITTESMPSGALDIIFLI